MWPFSSRENYLPKVVIKKDFDTGKFFAYQDTGETSLWSCSLYKDGFGQCFMSLPDAPTKFDTLDDLFEALYSIAREDHLKDLKKVLSNRSLGIST